jgi:hypothetical protein
MTTKFDIIKSNVFFEDDFFKSSSLTSTGKLLKSRGLPVGSIRDWKGGKYKKTGPNKWTQIKVDDKKSSGILSKVKDFLSNNFGLSLSEEYKSKNVKSKFGVSEEVFALHLTEYLKDKKGWNKKLSGTKKESTVEKKKTATKGDKKKKISDKKDTGKKINNNLMKFIAQEYGDLKPGEKKTGLDEIKDIKKDILRAVELDKKDAQKALQLRKDIMKKVRSLEKQGKISEDEVWDIESEITETKLGRKETDKTLSSEKKLSDFSEDVQREINATLNTLKKTPERISDLKKMVSEGIVKDKDRIDAIKYTIKEFEKKQSEKDEKKIKGKEDIQSFALNKNYTEQESSFLNRASKVVQNKIKKASNNEMVSKITDKGLSAILKEMTNFGRSAITKNGYIVNGRMLAKPKGLSSEVMDNVKKESEGKTVVNDEMFIPKDLSNQYEHKYTYYSEKDGLTKHVYEDKKGNFVTMNDVVVSSSYKVLGKKDKKPPKYFYGDDQDNKPKVTKSEDGEIESVLMPMKDSNRDKKELEEWSKKGLKY